MGTIGFIGLGIMGKPMAKNLLAGGCALLVNDIDKDAEAALAALGATVASPVEMAKACDIIFTILPNGAVVQEVLLSAEGITRDARPNLIVVDMSSVTPTESQTCADALARHGIAFLDCPVSGGEPGAIAGTLAFMCGGKQEDFDRVVPYFDIMGSSAVLIGGTGAGSVTKLANQVIVNLTIAAVSEALVLASKAGADPQKVYQAIRGGLAGSAVLDAKAPMMMARNFTPGGKISINHKDIKNVVNTAHDLDVPVPLSSQLFEIMQALKVAGHMEDDHSGIVQHFEKLAQVEVKKHEEA